MEKKGLRKRRRTTGPVYTRRLSLGCRAGNGANLRSTTACQRKPVGVGEQKNEQKLLTVSRDYRNNYYYTARRELSRQQSAGNRRPAFVLYTECFAVIGALEPPCFLTPFFWRFAFVRVDRELDSAVL